MRNFTNKLWNIGRFIIDFAPEDAQHLGSPVIPAKAGTHTNNYLWIPHQVRDDKDKQILERLSKTIEAVTKAIDSYRLHDAADALYEFIWHEFADKYVEATKNRRSEAQPVLEYVFRTCLQLLHPFMPFITEELWQKLPHSDKSIIIAKWPEAKLTQN